jgi:drug/metabolite transporter (DMT)-like permease
MKPKEIFVFVLAIAGSIFLLYLKGKNVMRDQILGVFFGVWQCLMFAFYIIFADRKLRLVNRADIDMIWLFSKLTVILFLIYAAMWFDVFEKTFNQKEFILSNGFYVLMALSILTLKMDPQEH